MYKRWQSEAETVELTDEQLWSRLLAWQTRREHSVHELSQKLLQLGVDPERIAVLVTKLQDYGLQSDARCAEVLWRSAVSQGKGLMAIRQRFKQKGLDFALVPAEQSADVDWCEEAVRVLHRRFGPAAAPDVKEQARRIRFLQYRGFSLSQAIDAIRR